MTTKPRANASPSSYAGDISVTEAWDLLRERQDAVLIDVRSAAETTFVGGPDLSALGKVPFVAEMQTFPGMAPNPHFLEAVTRALDAAGTRTDSPVLFLCRSGARSRAAAIALTNAGFTACFNIAGGFEGDLDQERHRGRRSGWKYAGLPWTQT